MSEAERASHHSNRAYDQYRSNSYLPNPEHVKNAYSVDNGATPANKGGLSNAHRYQLAAID